MAPDPPFPPHTAIDFTTSPPSSPSRPLPRSPTYTLQASSTANILDWDRFPPQSSSSRSSASSHTYPRATSTASRTSSSTLADEDADRDRDDLVALDDSSIARVKPQSEDPYGDLEAVATDQEEDGAFMMEEMASVEETTRAPKDRRGERIARARRRRWRCIVMGSMMMSLLVVLAVAGRRRIPGDWRFERWRSSAWQSSNSGGDGSIVRMEDGSEFRYSNKFGGMWNSTPFSTAAIAQSYTPPLAIPWDYSTQRIHGVNLGGWLTLEPFITPSIFEPFLNASPPAIDEWTLSLNLGGRLAEAIEHHYATFITEHDFAQIAGAGLNWVRIPLPFWAVEVRAGEPYLAHVSWKYFLKAMGWARKYGLRINLDLHAVPGSQNGWNHSGRSGHVGFMNGVMGVANAQRTLNIIRALAEFLALPENAEVVPMFSVLNEPFMETIGFHALKSFYLETYRTVRDASGLGEGHGPVMVFHDGFKGTARWYHWLEGADRIALDSHRYIAFRQPNLDPLEEQAFKPCAIWATDFNRTMAQVGLAMTGEWSVAVNDCGRYLNGVGLGTRFEGTFPTPEEPNTMGVSPVGSCEQWEDYTKWSEEIKAGLMDVALAHMDAFQNWFYWTWKTGPSLLSPTPNQPANPVWSYSLGLAQGYIPLDPRTSHGFCDANAKAHDLPAPKRYRFARPLFDWQTGRGPVEQLGKVNTTRADREGWSAFPPEWVGRGEGRLRSDELPRWVRGEGDEGKLRVQGPRPERVNDGGTEWKVVGEERGWWVEEEGCEYLSPWEGVGASVPEGACTGPWTA